MTIRPCFVYNANFAKINVTTFTFITNFEQIFVHYFKKDAITEVYNFIAVILL